jgi:hypothetical protein
MRNGTNVVVILSTALMLQCGAGIEPQDPVGIAVWSDDRSEIACAINKSDYDSRIFKDHPTNERYDLVIYDSVGNPIKTIFSDRHRKDGTGAVASLFYMKTKGYILMKTSGLIEMISLSGNVVPLCSWTCLKDTSGIEFIPSPSGTIVAKLISYTFFRNSDYQKKCQIVILDSTMTKELKKTNMFDSPEYSTVKWVGDSLIEVSQPYNNKFKIIRMDMTISDGNGSHCREPLTSSSPFSSEKGHVFFDSKSSTLKIEPLPDSVSNCFSGVKTMKY